MNLDKSQLTNMTNRQKAIVGVVALVVIVIIWQVIGLFGGESSSSSSAPPTTFVSNSKSNTSSQKSTNPNLRPEIPTAAQVSTVKPSQQEEQQLARLQQETQMKYVLALNDLQMLKLSQAVAETNKDIAKAKLDTVKAQKDIVDLLTAPPKAETPYAGGYQGPGVAESGGGRSETSLPAPQAVTSMPTPTMQPAPATTGFAQTKAPSDNKGEPEKNLEAQASVAAPTVNYVMVSVSQLLNKWSAIIAFKGKLYSVFVGDVLPPDGSTVVAIDKYSIILEKDGIQRKVSMVPLI